MLFNTHTYTHGGMRIQKHTHLHKHTDRRTEARTHITQTLTPTQTQTNSYTLTRPLALALLWPVSFPCGLQQRELLPQYRTPLLDSPSGLWEVEFNSSIQQDKSLLEANVTLTNHTAEDDTEVPTFRMVGAKLDRQGGSPWQVRGVSGVGEVGWRVGSP